MGEERLNQKLDQIMPLVFRQAPVDELAKSRLRQKLFQGAELTDDALSSVAAAGNANVLRHKKTETE